MTNTNLNENSGSVWARPGMEVTFRAEVMPGVEREKRTFRVKSVLPNGSVTLHDYAGEHAERSFVSLQFNKRNAE